MPPPFFRTWATRLRKHITLDFNGETDYAKGLLEQPMATISIKRLAIRRTMVAFTFSATVYGLAAYMTNRETEYYEALALAEPNRPIFPENPFRTASDWIQRKRYEEEHQMAQAAIQNADGAAPATILSRFSKAGGSMARTWADLPDANRACALITAAEAAIVTALVVCPRSLRLQKTFLHHALGKTSYTVITSSFAHIMPVHFLMNNAALWVYGGAFTFVWISEQQHPRHLTTVREATSLYHMLAFYVSASVISGWAQDMYALFCQWPRALNAETCRTLLDVTLRSSSRGNIRWRCGSSGAGFALAVIGCWVAPNPWTAKDTDITSMGAPIIPMQPLPFVAVAYELGGLAGLVPYITGGGIIAHLAGTVFGIGYHLFGMSCWENIRRAMGAPVQEDDGGGVIFICAPRSRP